MTVVVAKLNGVKRDIPKAFKLTNDLAKDDLKHLRRLRHLPDETLECIICKSNHSTSNAEELEELEKRFQPENIFTDFRFAQVPSKSPRTEQQLIACNAIWPCKFAKCNHLVKCIDGTLLTNAETLVLNIIVEEAFNKLKSSDNASIAVIYRCSKVYGVGVSSKKTIEDNPVKHSTMLAIDSVAYNYNAGYWKDSSADDIMKSIQSRLDDQASLKDHRLSDSFLPYLCTEFDIFITEEPCFMCTMGLVQSRIRRLFYLGNSTRQLGCRENLCYPDRAIRTHMVHRDKNLNHRFEAWDVVIDQKSQLMIPRRSSQLDNNKIVDSG